MKDQKGETTASADAAARSAQADMPLPGAAAGEAGSQEASARDDAAAPSSSASGAETPPESPSAESPTPEGLSPEGLSQVGPTNEELAGQRILEMEAEVKSLQDQVLRTHADMENLRRRTEREMRDARAYAISNFAKEVLGVADNLERALTALPDEARASGDTALLSLVEGIELTQRELVKALQKQGVAPILADQARFDPNLHQAMFEVPNPDVPNNTVVQVVQTGYTIGERVLRPAMVGVAKGGPKVAANAGKDATTGTGANTESGSGAGSGNGPGASVDRTA